MRIYQFGIDRPENNGYIIFPVIIIKSASIIDENSSVFIVRILPNRIATNI